MNDSDRWAYVQEQERLDNIKGCKVWLRAMILATIAGFVIGYCVK